MTTKIVFVGKPEMGKTTIKKVVFEGSDPNELVLFPLEATITQKFSVHEFMDSKIILLDTAGQSLSSLLQDEGKQIRSFENSNAIIYIFDYPTYIENSEEIIEDIRRLYEINEKHQFNAKIILFLHKIDLMVSQKIGIKLALVAKQINKLLKLPEELNIYFTSLHPNLIYTIYNALSGTIGDLSEKISNLKKEIGNLIQNYSKTICFIFNHKDNQIIQEISNDFNTSTLYNLNEQINRLMSSTDDIKAISFETKIFHSIFENVLDINPQFKRLILLSETINREELRNVAVNIKDKLKL